MNKLAVLSAAALIGLGAVASTSTTAEARYRGGAIAAGVIGGLAAGALIGAAASSAYAAPYGYYGYGYAPAYGYAPGYAYAPAYTYGYAAPVVSVGFGPAYYGYRPVYRTTRVVYRGPGRTTRVIRYR
jgi:hypothetical protein